MQHNIGKDFIIGGGITGLIWNLYHPEFAIITPESSAETFTRTYLVWMHDEVETRKLLYDLEFKNIESIQKKSLIGYYNKHWICDFLTEEMNTKLIQKKMTNWNEGLDSSFLPKNSEMSKAGILGNNYLLSLDVDLNEVVRRLNNKAKIINAFVTKIDDNSIIIKQKFTDPEGQRLEYDKLISTIAAPFFWKGYGQEKEFKCLPITNIITSVRPDCFNDKYEMIYYDDTMPFSRISHLNNKYAIEFTGEISKDEFEKRFPKLKVDDYFVVKQGRIFENKENIPPNDKITFTGRFGLWKYGITTEHTIKQALDYKLSNK